MGVYSKWKEHVFNVAQNQCKTWGNTRNQGARNISLHDLRRPSFVHTTRRGGKIWQLKLGYQVPTLEKPSNNLKISAINMQYFLFGTPWNFWYQCPHKHTDRQTDILHVQRILKSSQLACPNSNILSNLKPFLPLRCLKRSRRWPPSRRSAQSTPSASSPSRWPWRRSWWTTSTQSTWPSSSTSDAARSQRRWFVYTPSLRDISQWLWVKF